MEKPAADETNTMKKAMIDHTSPYYLSANDYPRQVHVDEALTDENYGDWAQDMYNFLFSKNKEGFVDGTLPMPEEGSVEQITWRRCDVMVRGWLTAAMGKDLRSSVRYATTAAQIWSDLRDRFAHHSAPRAYELKRILASTRQEGATISVYYTRLRNLWDEMGSVGGFHLCPCGVDKKAPPSLFTTRGCAASRMRWDR